MKVSIVASALAVAFLFGTVSGASAGLIHVSRSVVVSMNGLTPFNEATRQPSQPFGYLPFSGLFTLIDVQATQLAPAFVGVVDRILSCAKPGAEGRPEVSKALAI